MLTIEEKAVAVSSLTCEQCSIVTRDTTGKVFCAINLQGKGETLQDAHLVDGTINDLRHRILIGMNNPSNEVACISIPVIPVRIHGQALNEDTEKGQQLLNSSVDVLELDRGIRTRALNCLQAEGIITIRQLTSYTENQLSKVPNLGPKSQNNIKNALKKIGLSLKAV